VSARRSAFLCLAIGAASLAALSPSAAEARGPVPPGFFGVSMPATFAVSDIAEMRGTVGTLRVPVFWFDCEPRRGEYDFTGLDEIVGEAATAGIRVLPFVYGSPRWMTGDPARPPLRNAAQLSAWRKFLRALAVRYGPRGDFWAGRADRLPIRRWQLWNEPNFPVFWAPRPSTRGYARLLTAGAAAVRAADPKARILLAGLAPVENGPLPWTYLRRLYEVPGVKRAFDVVGLHPYASSTRTLQYEVEKIRGVMAEAGDRRTPLEVTEFGVASARTPQNPMVKTPQGQSEYLRESFLLLLANRRRWHLSGADWFTWRDGLEEDPHCVFCQHSGLLESDGDPKPAWGAYREIARRRTG
jgi:hypothetical protein